MAKNTDPCTPYCLGVPFPEWATWVPLQYTVSYEQKHDTRYCVHTDVGTVLHSVVTRILCKLPRDTGYRAHSIGNQVMCTHCGTHRILRTLFMTLGIACKHTVYTRYMTPGTRAHISHDTGWRVLTTQGDEYCEPTVEDTRYRGHTWSDTGPLRDIAGTQPPTPSTAAHRRRPPGSAREGA